MKKHRLVVFTLLVMFGITLLANIVYANSAEPPSITIIVPNAPDDIKVSLVFADESVSDEDMRARSSIRRGWETYFRWNIDLDSVSLEGAMIAVSSANYNFECGIPDKEWKSYNNIFTLDLNEGELKDGAYTGRYALIVAVRVGLTLLLEGVIFLLFRYFDKRSWLCFIFINLITQAGVNIALYGVDMDSYLLLGYIFIEVFVFLAESIAFPAFLHENGKKKAVVYALSANTVSLVVGGLLISHLPV